jgi:hypothetical protein
MANHADKGTSGRADVDLSESSVYGDDVATKDRIDRLEAIAGGDDKGPLVLKGKLRRQFDALDASTEEELDALQVDLVQEGDAFDARDGSGRVDDDVAEDQIAAFTEVGPMADDRGAVSVAPGRNDTSAVLRRHRPHSEAGNDWDEIVESNIDPPLDEELYEDEPEHHG